MCGFCYRIIKKNKSIWVLFIVLFASSPGSFINAQQLNIPRVEKMPNLPSPYNIRDWKKVTAGYDELVFNSSLQGQYLPLIFDRNNTVNYPTQKSFGIQSFVGTNSPQQGEAINVLPAVVGASLIGIDKSNQNGRNYVLECREYFNKRAEENIYLNHPVGNSGNDWWYETMPNVFFYQLYSLYPNTPDFNNQFVTVADRWLQAVYAMGGSTTPWKIPNMYYRAWNFSSMFPNASGVPEPEASGAIAWILYNAFSVTKEEKYRVGAELAMEYLNSLTSNPAYEIQLPYGTYLAARMNAELQTNYDLEKLVNWCFDFTSLRNWNVIVGKWGIYDVAGLIGEDFVKQYAFSMNTFQQIGALIPMVRYDERFARAIGKWVLNAANSSRLFYSKYLDDLRQDSEDWAKKYDPNSYISYEALLKTDSGWPEATGDAVKGGWAKTNLSLYSSSSVGYLGAVIDTTNVPMILKLDLRKTDFYQKKAFPTYLFFNPYNQIKSVEFDAGNGSYDLYEVLSNTFIRKGITGKINFDIPGDSAIMIVLCPAGGKIEYYLDHTLCNGTVIDYHNGNRVSNFPPRIKAFASTSDKVTYGRTIKLYCTAEDRDAEQLKYIWKTLKGSLSGNKDAVEWTSPNEDGNVNIKVIVEDQVGQKDSSELIIQVSKAFNSPPKIKKMSASPRKINLVSDSVVSCLAEDEDNDVLTYQWFAKNGLITGTGNNVTWTSPGAEGNYFVKCEVVDSHGASALDSIGIVVRDFSKNQTGSFIAFYPFNGNANDGTINHNNGIIDGAQLTPDRFGNANQAYSFNGVSDNIRVPNSTALNFRNSITISLWIKIGTIYNREAFLISHGSWQNRWKISLTNKKVRWTIKTDSNINSGIKDLDSETELIVGKDYLVTVVYSGSDIEIWLNGELDSFSTWSGLILPTSFDLMIAQMLPGDNGYNFKGVIDDIKIYDYALSVDEIQKLYDFKTNVEEQNKLPAQFMLYQNYPNPFNPETTIQYTIPSVETRRGESLQHVILRVYDVLGREVATLVNEEQSVGIYKVNFNVAYISDLRNSLPSGVYFYRLTTDKYSSTKKMLLLK